MGHLVTKRLVAALLFAMLTMAGTAGPLRAAPQANQAPLTVRPIPDQTMDVQAGPFDIDLAAVFADADRLVFSVRSDNEKVAAVVVEGTTLTVRPGAEGVAEVTVQAFDPLQAVAVDVFIVAVGDPGAQLAPATEPIPDQVLTADGPDVSLELSSVFTAPAEGKIGSYQATTTNKEVVQATVSRTGELVLVPGEPGMAWVEVEVYDDDIFRPVLIGKDEFAVVVQANTPPKAADDGAATSEDTPVAIEVLANDEDPDGDALDPASIAIVDKPARGEVDLDAEKGVLIYTPASNEAGEDQFTYTVRDERGAVSNPATVSLKIEPVPDAPIAENDAITLLEDCGASVCEEGAIYDVLANDEDPDGDALTYDRVTVLEEPAHGEADVLAASISYRPVADYNGDDRLQYVIADASGLTDTATVYIKVRPINDPPVVQAPLPDLTLAPEDPPVERGLAGVFADVDDGDRLQYEATSENPDVVSARISEDDDGMPLVVVDGLQEGSTTVAVIATDDLGATATDVFAVTVTQGNVPPVVANPLSDRTLTLGDPATEIDLVASAVFEDDDGDPLSYSAESEEPSVADVVVEGGTVTLTPVAEGTTTVTITADDGNGGQAEDTFTVTVEDRPNRPPTTASDAAGTPEDEAVTIDVLANDEDPDEDALDSATVTVVAAPGHGTATVHPETGAITYAPAADYHGTDTFSYTVADVQGAVSDATDVTVVVQPVNDPPVRVDRIANQSLVAGGTPYRRDLDAAPVVFEDVDGDVLTYIATSENPSVAEASIDGTAVEVLPLSEGAATITVTANDNHGGTAQVMFQAQVSDEPNIPPVANDDGATIAEDEVAVLEVLDNDVDDDGDALMPASVQITQAPSNGTTAVDAETGVITYTPTPDFNGSDRFAYAVSDERGAGSNAATVRITITPVNDAPSPPVIIDPPVGAQITIGGGSGEAPVPPGTPFAVSWDASDDPEDDAVAYTWQLALDETFAAPDVLLTLEVGQATTATADIGTLAALLSEAGLGLGEAMDVHHRVVANDGELATAGAPVAVTVVRGTVVSATDEGEVPDRFTVQGNYPNPFNPATTLRFDLPQAARVWVEVYDLHGRRRLTTQAQPVAAGSARSVTLDLALLPSGVYLYRLLAETAEDRMTATGRVVLLK